MTRPFTYLARMLVFLVGVAVVAVLLSQVLITIFEHNIGLNTLILSILVLGAAWNLRQVLRLSPEVTWVEAYQTGRRRQGTPTPKLLAPMASMLASRDAASRPGQSRFTLSPTATRSLLDSIASRLDESRELSRYMIGLLIFLGLLGTFWGLLKTVGSVSDVIHGMSVGSGTDFNQMFEQLKSGLAGPLQGMGTAFSASLFGLSGALVLGFLDLTAGQAQNRFFNELEEWLAGLTRLSSGVLAEGEASVPVYVQALLEQTAENMEGLQNILARGEESRSHANQAVLALTEKMGAFSDTMRANQQLMLRIAETQTQLGPALQRLAERRSEGPSEDAARAHLRNIEIYLQRLLTETEQGRLQSTAELRNDLRILTRTIAAIAEEQR